MGDDMADETLIKKRITTYTKTVSKSNLTNSDVMFVDNPTEGTRKMYPKAIIDNTITSSGVHVKEDNYSSIITDVNDQPVNTIYLYNYNLKSKIANLPSDNSLSILHYSHNYSDNTSAGQFMIAIERGNNNECSIYFRSTSGNPVTWNDWTKVANTSELSNVFTGERLRGDTDLNTITTQGIYFIHSSTTYANCPVDKQNGLLEVWLNNSNNNPDRIFQRLTTQSEDYDQKVYFRIYSSYYNKWTPWEECGSEKKYIRILFIGNSLIQDGVSYLPYILKTYYPEVSFEIYMWYNSGHTLQQNYEKFLSGTPCKIFSTAINTATWTQNKDNMKMSEILTTMKFDIVCMQPFLSVAEVDTELDAWNNCIDYIKSNYTGGNSLKFVSILHAPKRSNVESDVTKFKAWKKALMTETICEDVIPMGLAIYNALSTELDSLGDQGHLSTDGVHAQEGLPCLLQAYILAQWILDELSIPKGIYNKKISITTEIYNSINVPGPNLGTGVITGTGDQNILAQEIAIKTYLNEKNAINIINNAITSSGVSVTADNYRSIITDVNNQPVNTIYAYAAGLQSSITNLPSNAALNILHYTYKYSTATNVGQVMIATECSGENPAMYFRSTSGTPVAWGSWVKVANSADVETDATLSISGKPADAKAAGDAIDNLKADINDIESDVEILKKDGIIIKDSVIEEKVSSWLNGHPEATTTVEDQSLTYKKIINGTLGFVTPEMFGAKGNGIDDDTIALQNAINSGKYVLLMGEYLVTSTVTISNSGQTIIGKKNSRIICNNDICVFNITGNRCFISNLYMVGNELGTAIQCNSPWNSFNDLYITNFKYGIKLQSTTGSIFTGLMLQSIINTGITIAGNNNDNYFSRCIFTMKQDSVGDCVYISNNVQAIVFEGSSFLRGSYGVRFVDDVNTSQDVQYSEYIGKVPSHCKFIGCFFDSSTIAGVLTGNSQNISFNNCWFSCRPNYGARINGYSTHISFTGCEFFFNRCGIRISNFAKDIIVSGCNFDTNGSLSVSSDDVRTSSAPAQDIWITETPTDYIITNCKFSNDLYGNYYYNNTKSATHISINENTGTTRGIITNNIFSEDCTWKTVANLSYITQSIINNNIPEVS